MDKLYSFHWDCGRMGDVHGLFIAHERDVELSIGKEVYFGEILGKHSEIYGTLKEQDIVPSTEQHNRKSKWIMK